MNSRISSELLQDKLSFKDAKSLQTKCSVYSLDINAKIENILPKEKVHIIAAVDVAYFQKDEKEWGIASAVFWDRVQNHLIESSFALKEINFPYRSGFLGFREANVISAALNTSTIIPDLIICDGHGLIHPRYFGEAVHLGLALNIASYGIAKNPYIGYYSKSLDRFKGNKVPIWESDSKGKSLENKKMGYHICLADERKPVFISIGYKIDLETAVQISLELSTNHRQPEPLYLADKLSKEKVKTRNQNKI